MARSPVLIRSIWFLLTVIFLGFPAAQAAVLSNEPDIFSAWEITVADNVCEPGSDTDRPGRPEVAFDGANFLIVTAQSTPNPTALVGTLISPAGTVIRQFTLPGHYRAPSVAFGGGIYLVIFDIDAYIYGIRVSTTGELLDSPQGFPISSPEERITNVKPTAAFDGERFLVVWQKFRYWGGVEFPIYSYDIFGAVVSLDGKATDEFPICIAENWQTVPQVAFNGSNYLVVWQSETFNERFESFYDIYGARVSRAGVLLDAQSIPISLAEDWQTAPHVASDGQNFMVVWAHDRTPPTTGAASIHGARIAADGTLLDGSPESGGFAINTFPGIPKANPRICFVNGNFFVAWWLMNYPPQAGSFAARVSPAGLLLDGPADAPGLSLRSPTSPFDRIVHPNPVAYGRSVFIPWVNNSETGGTSKTIYANVFMLKPRIASVQHGLNPGTVKITFTTEPDWIYRIQTSADLLTWQNSNIRTNGTGSIVQLEAPAGQQTFFRVVIGF